MEQTVAIIGATGQVGTPLTRNLLEMGHNVRVLVRVRAQSDTGRLAEYEKHGAEIVEVPDMLNVDALSSVLGGADALVAAVPGSQQIITESEPIWIQAAVKAGVKRYVPSEFGCHTRQLSLGDGILFDYKKALHEKIFASGIGWTFIYTGGIFDYFLPNLRFFHKITTFGDLDLPIYTHDIADIGRLAAMAITDPRTLNKCVQLDLFCPTQREMVAELLRAHPTTNFETEHFSSEFIANARLNASDEQTAKRGAETDRERWGINYVIYVLGKLHGFTADTVRATELWPDCRAGCRTPQQAISDPAFVFDSGAE